MQNDEQCRSKLLDLVSQRSRETVLFKQQQSMERNASFASGSDIESRAGEAAVKVATDTTGSEAGAVGVTVNGPASANDAGHAQENF